VERERDVNFIRNDAHRKHVRKEGRCKHAGADRAEDDEGVHLLSAVGACYVSHVRERAGNHRVLEAPE
jgi:hypothetical protein